MIRHALGRAMLGTAFLALNACSATSGPTQVIPSTPAANATAATPTAAATPPQTPAPTPSGDASTGGLGQSDLNHPLAAGTYRIADTFGAPFEITVPVYWRLKALTASDVQFAYTVDGENHPAWVVVDLVDNVFEDPCHSASGPADPPVPATVDGVVDALTSMKGFEAGPVTDVSNDGLTGKAVDIVNTIDTASAACDGEMLPLWSNKGGGGGSTPADGRAREQIRVVEVNGAPAIIDGETLADTTKGLQDETRQVLESIRFE